MKIILERNIRDALLALKWKREGNEVSPGYFVRSSSESLQLETNAACFLAHFIAEYVAFHIAEGRDDLYPTLDDCLDGYSLEEVATYLEDHNYTVSSPS